MFQKMLEVCAYIVVYLILFIAGIKFYLWSRRQQKKYQKRWTKRFGLLLFFAPVIIFLMDLCLPLPEQWVVWLKYLVSMVDYTLAWIKNCLEPILGTWGYFLVKPIISALLYAFLGMTIGSLVDLIFGKPASENEDKERQQE